MRTMGEMGRRQVLAGMGTALLAGGCAHGRRGPTLLHRDDFRYGLGQWLVEAEQPAQVSAVDGVLDIAAPAGITLWFRPELSGPVAIDYTVAAIGAGGPYDQVSDVNAFWMATDTRAPAGNVLDMARSGAFTDYDRLRMYYVGIGGNRNTTTRLRRYVGRDGDRPLLPEHDRTDPAAMIVPNQPIRIRLIADGAHIAVLRDSAPLFTMRDSAPYTRGHLGLRTTWSHLAVRDFAVWRL
jgi:hypothetical protein